ncbi:MAG: dethiobiotin synthase [Arcobacteraceae bacterium]
MKRKGNTKQVFFITATNTNVGKSYASEVFLKKFAKKGKKVGYFKPIETGVKTTPLDGSKLLKITQKLNSSFSFSLEEVVPYQFTLAASPFVANNENRDIDPKDIINQAKKLLQKCDVLIVEGAGGLMVPITKNYFMIDLIKKFQKKLDAQTILISSSSLGSINDSLLSIQALENYKLHYKWYINLYKDKKSFTKTTFPFYKEYFDKIVFL